MELQAKIYTKELTDIATSRKYSIYKAILLNAKKEEPLYVDVKFFLKKDLVDKIIKESDGGFFDINVSKVTKKEFTKKSGERAFQYTIHVDKLQELPITDNFRDELDRILQKKANELISEMLD